MIEKERIHTIKQGVDLVTLIQSKGIPLKKNGKSYFGLCPFHKDTNPSLSVNPTENLWQCFGCGKGGDVIRFVEMYDKIDFPQAVSQLSGIRGQLSAKEDTTDQRQRTTNLSAKHLKLLSRVIEFYHTAFCEDTRARDYLIRRGITDNALFSTYKTGFSNGTLLNVLPDDGDIIQDLKEMGILNDKGNEHFYGCVTFPLYDLNGNPCGIYGRRIDEMNKSNVPDHLYLPGPRHGLFNRQAAKSHKEIILTESIIDALTLINAGIRNAIPCYGTNGLTEDHISLFKQHEVETVSICLDGDASGKEATETVSTKLQSKSIRTYPIILPEDQDINSFFSLAADAPARFKDLLSQANPDAVKEEDAKEERESFTATEHGFITTINARKYEIRGITKGDTKLKATVKGIKLEKTKKRFHVDTVDFYSARSRAYLSRVCAISLKRRNRSSLGIWKSSLNEPRHTNRPKRPRKPKRR